MRGSTHRMRRRCCCNAMSGSASERRERNGRYGRRVSDGARRMMSGLVQAARLSAQDEVADLLAEQGRELGARAVTIYLIDHAQLMLVPLKGAGAPVQPAVP